MAAVISLAAIALPESRFLRKVEMVEVFCLINDSCRAYDLAVIIDKDVAHDREHPSLEVYIVHIFVFVVKGFEGCVLNKVVGVVAVACEKVCKVKKVALKVEKLGLEVFGAHNVEFLIGT